MKRTTLYFLLMGLFLFVSASRAQVSSQSDVIAVRVLPNFEHFSALQWYQSQNFSGSPQSVTVDGYDAVRDGRTVYINVGNISGTDLYTNIYLITYNLEAGQDTQDIFGQIIKHWKFNTNVAENGHCRSNNTIVCSIDDNCPIKDFCDSRKSLVIRDTKRLADLSYLRNILAAYYAKKGSYPKLSAGTYLPEKTISVWPSWQQSFSKEVGYSLPLDPVNQIGRCCPTGAEFTCNAGGHYDENTCWDETKKIFSTTLPAVPYSSMMYTYAAESAGAAYTLCAFLESGYSVGGKSLISASCPSLCMDLDYDGYGLYASSKCKYGAADCNDTDASVFGGAGEVCTDGIDNDCDGYLDCADIADCAANPSCIAASGCDYNNVCDPDETVSSCPHDCNPCGDGICNEALECSGMAFASCGGADCSCGNGIIDCGEECDGGAGCDSTCSLATFTCTDADKDRYIAEGTPAAACGNVCGTGGESCLGNNDCDDGNSTVRPGSAEICDGIDNDCDGTDDEGFAEEECGYVCTALSFLYNYSSSRSDDLRCCGDDALEGLPYGFSEVGNCTDGHDNDCDGKIDASASAPDEDCLACDDENFVNESSWYWAGQSDCDQCNLEGDQDGDQPGDWSAHLGMADKCDSDCGSVVATVQLAKFEATETSCDGIDNDCDGTVDEVCAASCDDADSDGFDNCAVGAVGDDGKAIDCNDGAAVTYPGAAEVCDGADNDCDGMTDEGCSSFTYCHDNDNDTYGDAGDAVSAFSAPAGYVLDCTDCDDTRNYVKPGGIENCDGLNNDCDLQADEGCDDDGDDYCDSTMLFYNYPLAVCPSSNLTNGASGNDCNDSSTQVYSGHAENCDGIDNDCNPATVDGSGESFYEAGSETSCSDGKDNDCDGKIDAVDPDCVSYCTFDAILPCVLN